MTNTSRSKHQQTTKIFPIILRGLIGVIPIEFWSFFGDIASFESGYEHSSPAHFKDASSSPATHQRGLSSAIFNHGRFNWPHCFKQMQLTNWRSFMRNPSSWPPLYRGFSTGSSLCLPPFSVRFDLSLRTPPPHVPCSFDLSSIALHRCQQRVAQEHLWRCPLLCLLIFQHMLLVLFLNSTDFRSGGSKLLETRRTWAWLLSFLKSRLSI
ncbi:hypothetical protein EDB80DRAFT_217779 [Ilyonectria destructans]|nr:hypothetical protein EDB80DRAFT_217779 [Ilyonectria destructans]